jgi:hypothetical protein
MGKSYAQPPRDYFPAKGVSGTQLVQHRVERHGGSAVLGSEGLVRKVVLKHARTRALRLGLTA